jgi:hypothetical protein
VSTVVFLISEVDLYPEFNIVKSMSRVQAYWRSEWHVHSQVVSTDTDCLCPVGIMD